jgi:hypothetical protein
MSRFAHGQESAVPAYVSLFSRQGSNRSPFPAFARVAFALIAFALLIGCPPPGEEPNEPPDAIPLVIVSGAGTTSVDGTYERTGATSSDGLDQRPIYIDMDTGNYIYAVPTGYQGIVLDDDLIFGNGLYYRNIGSPSWPVTIASDGLYAEDGVDPPPEIRGEISFAPSSGYLLPIGTTVQANYRFEDPDGDSESGTTYQWFRSIIEFGTYTEIAGATTGYYTVQPGDEDYYLKVEVTPSDGTDAGDTVTLGPSWPAGTP